MSAQHNRRRGVLAAAGAVATGLAAFLAIGLGASAASATEGNNPSGKASATISPDTDAHKKGEDKGKGRDEDCDEKGSKGKICKKIPWCPPGKITKPSKDVRVVEAIEGSESPTVLLDKSHDGKKGGDEPRCVYRPYVKVFDKSDECCKYGEGLLKVHVYNPNKPHVKLLNKVWVEGPKGTKTDVAWIKGGQHESFEFDKLKNGAHKVHVAVLIKDKHGKWVVCEVFKKVVKIICKARPSHSPSPTPSETTSPSPSPSASTSPTESPSPSPSISTSPASGTGGNGDLPKTGAGVALLVMAGVAALGGGGVMYTVARRRRTRFTS